MKSESACRESAPNAARAGFDSAAEAAFGKVRGLRGWRRRLAAFGAGLAAALAQAPFYLLPLLALGYCLLALLVDGAKEAQKPGRAGFAAGWFFGFGYFLLGLYWTGYSFMVQAEEFAWMAPFGVAGLPAILALFVGAATAAAAKLSVGGWRRILALAVFLSIADYARGHLFTGLPWNLPAQALAGTAVGAQTAAWWGAYALSFIALAVAMAPVAFPGRRHGLKIGLAALFAATLALYAVGAGRLALASARNTSDFFVRIVQPNIPQREKIDTDLWRRNFDIHVALSSAPAPKGTLYILWPENAVPVIDEIPEALDRLGDDLPYNAVLITGAVRRATDEQGETRYYNSISVMAPTENGFRPVAHYDKHHLVPFGEYLPFEGLLRAIGLAQLAPYDDGFTDGEGPRTISAGGTSFAPLICYEAIFPGEIYPRGRRPDWIATVTNDSWFGDSSGPRQHFDQARLRSIETGLPMARSANSGVSGLIDGAGRVIDRIPLYERGVIDAPLPAALPPTLYSRIGDLAFLLFLAGAAAAAFFPLRTRT